MTGYETYDLMQFLMAAGFVAAVLLLFVTALAVSEYRNRKFQMRRIRNSWGNFRTGSTTPRSFWLSAATM